MGIVLAILLFGFIVFFHELGHFLLAKKNGIRVVEFSIGMGPRLFSFEKGDTRYSLKLLFFGGSCQMLSEDFFEDEELEKDKEHAFENKSVWARIAVVVAGPLFNFLLAWVLAVIVMGGVGYDEPFITYVQEGSAAEKAGLQQEDIIRELNGEKITLSREIDVELYVNPVSKDTVELVYERNGKKYTAEIEPEYVEKYAIGITYSIQEGDSATIAEVVEEGPFEKAGGKKGDIIRAVNGTEIDGAKELKEYFTENPLKDKEIKVTIERGGETQELAMTPVLSSKGYSMGFSYNSVSYTHLTLPTNREV